MPRKRVDERVRGLIHTAVRTHTRGFLVIVGDRARDQVINLHYILSKATVKARPSVLWCYNKELGFSTHRQKRMKHLKKLASRGVLTGGDEDPLESFLTHTHVRWCYYKETARVLGNTYGMAVLQDFEAITPNILCRTIETVSGGGLVVLLLSSMRSLTHMYTLAMDVHARLRSEARGDVVGRFNESLAGGAPAAAPGTAGADDDEIAIERLVTPSESELSSLKSSLAGSDVIARLGALSHTLDQARALLTAAEAIAEKTLHTTVAITAGRGRGKSAALGLSIAAALAYGYVSVCVSSPTPENCATLFEFLFKGLDALAYKEHIDYEAIASTNPEFNKAIVRVNVFRGHRQSVQWIEPGDTARAATAELLVIDEAAAIPLPVVKALMGPYLVFLASTVNGYEGTGRSLSLKLIQQLRMQQAAAATAASTLAATSAFAGGASAAASADPWAAAAASSDRKSLTTAAAAPGLRSSGIRTLREVTMNTPIRYADGDPIEKWLNDLLCLDATTPYRLGGRLPAPSECELFAVDRDALFSFHKLSEAFLHRMMSLYVSSHYKNSPNDLQLMSDAPSHKLFVLLGPAPAPDAAAVAADPLAALPDILCVVQVCLEGEITKEAVRAALARGNRGNGDLIPWTLSMQFQDDGFPSLSGARVVRIATHPDATKMGYGTRALELLAQYFQGQCVPLDDAAAGPADDWVGGVDRGMYRVGAPPAADEGSTLATEKVRPRKQLPPLLMNVHDIRRPEYLHWIGVSYGMTQQLFNFWKRAGYLPVYLRQTANDLTAEHTMIMLKGLAHGAPLASGRVPKEGWHLGFVGDFAHRYMQLLSFEFRSLDPTLALTVLDAACSALPAPPPAELTAAAAVEDGDDVPVSKSGDAAAPRLSVEMAKPLTPQELAFIFSPYDLKRLEAYARSVVDYHLILDLLPDVARLFFMNRVSNAHLPRLQCGILMGIGLQRLTVEQLAEHFGIAVNQVLALFNKAVRKVTLSLSSIQEKAAEAKLERVLAAARGGSAPTDKAAKKGTPVAAAAAAAVGPEAELPDEELQQYKLPTDERQWSAALSGVTPTRMPETVQLKRGDASTSASHAGDKRRSGGSAVAFQDAEVYDPRGRLSGGKVKKARSAKA